jgi:predicted permease
MGFDRVSALTAKISLPAQSYAPGRRVRFYDDLVARLRAAPGVKQAAMMYWTPVVDGEDGWSIMTDGRVIKNIADSPTATPEQVTPGYFAAMGIPLVSGRLLEESDRMGAPYVCVVNETMARELWPGQNAVGHTIKMFDSIAPWVTVVGVVRDIRQTGAQGNVPLTMFFPYSQAERSAYYTPASMTVLLRTSGDPVALAGSVRQAVHELDASVPVSDVRTLDDAVGSAYAGRRFSTMLLAGFAVLALTLTGIGIYGVISYGVSQRTYEIGLRMAMGAGAGAVLRLVISEGVRLALVGLAIGLAGGVAISLVARSLLVGVTAFDTPTMLTVSAALLAVAALASFVPARRAVGVSPTEALRGG